LQRSDQARVLPCGTYACAYFKATVSGRMSFSYDRQIAVA